MFLAQIVWKRPEQFLPASDPAAPSPEDQKIGLFHAQGDDAVEPTDILQGAIGDCYFLSSLSVLAEQDDRVKHLFFKNDPASDRNLDAALSRGLFAVRFCVQGHWTELLLDDKFPCNPDEVEIGRNGAPNEVIVGEPIFSHSKGALRGEAPSSSVAPARAASERSARKPSAGLRERALRREA